MHNAIWHDFTEAGLRFHLYLFHINSKLDQSQGYPTSAKAEFTRVSPVIWKSAVLQPLKDLFPQPLS
jgi:hypothetical protein